MTVHTSNVYSMATRARRLCFHDLLTGHLARRQELSGHFHTGEWLAALAQPELEALSAESDAFTGHGHPAGTSEIGKTAAALMEAEAGKAIAAPSDALVLTWIAQLSVAACMEELRRRDGVVFSGPLSLQAGKPVTVRLPWQPVRALAT